MPRYLRSLPDTIADGRGCREANWRELGRDPATVDLTLFGCRQNRPGRRRRVDAGVRSPFVLPGQDEPDTLDRLERLAERVRSPRPAPGRV